MHTDIMEASSSAGSPNGESLRLLEPAIYGFYYRMPNI
jgi:hypothetical protein